MANSQDTRINATQDGGESSRNFGTAADSRGDGLTGTATAAARTFYDQAKETAGKAYEAVTDKTAQKLDEQKSTLSDGLSTVADSVRQVSQNLGTAQTDSGLAGAAAKYSGTAARRIEDVAGYFERKSVRDMAHDLEGFARRNPAIFLGAAFGVGVLLARFLKSTPPSGPGGSDRQRSGKNEFGRSARKDFGRAMEGGDSGTFGRGSSISDTGTGPDTSTKSI